METCSFSIKSLIRFVSCTVFLLLTWTVALPFATAGDLHVTGSWKYSDSDAGAATDSQNYSASYSGRTDVTDLIKVGGSLRYTKSIRDTLDTDFISPSLFLRNANDIYSLSLTGTYNYTTQNQGLENESWNWNSRLNSAWENRLWPTLSVYYGQNGSSSGDIKQGSSDRAGFDTRWTYWQWLTLAYDLAWQESSGATASKNESLRQNARLNASKSFWDNRARFNFGQSYAVNESDITSFVTSGGFALRDLLEDDNVLIEVFYEESNTPLTNPDPLLLDTASFLLNDRTLPEPPPTTLTIDPINPDMNLILFIDFHDAEVLHLYTTVDIDSFDENIVWQLYEGSNGMNDWTLVSSPVPVYDPVEQRFEFDFGAPVNNRYIKLVADPGALLPAQVADLNEIEVFRKVFGTGSTVTTTSEDKHWRSNLGMAFKLSDTVSLSYNASYSKQEERNFNERESIGNNGSVTWSPTQYFQARINASDNRQKINDGEDFISRNYGLSVSSQPLPTLGLSSGFSRNESYTGSTLDRAVNFYSIHANAKLYRDLQASLDMSFTNPQEGGGSDSWSSTLYVTSRLTPALLLYWTSSYNRDLDTSAYDFGNAFRLNWRTSEFMYLNASLQSDYRSGADLQTRLTLGMGFTPNRKHRINLGYLIDDYDGDINQTVSTNWSWVITQVFNFRMAWNYRLADERSWLLTGSLFARFL